MALQPQGFPNIGTPIADPETGKVSASWRRFFTTIWNRIYTAAVQTPITAAGTRIDTATQLSADWNEVATVPSGSGVVLPALAPGQDIIVFNAGVNALNVYPAPTYAIDAMSVGSPYVLAAGKMQWFRTLTVSSSAGRMRSMQLG